MARQPVTPYRDGKENATPAPTRPAKVAPPDVVSEVRRQQNAGNMYGMNGFRGASSANPGEMVRSPLAENIKSASEQGSDPLLNAVIQKGVGAGGVDPMTGDAVTMSEGAAGTQIRKMMDRPAVPDHPAMASARSRQSVGG